MVALAFAERYPQLVKHIVAISAADRPHPMATAWRSVQRAMVRYAAQERRRRRKDLRLARALAMATYRSPEEFAARFSGAPARIDGRFQFPVESYLLARGDAYAATYVPEAFVCLSESIDLHTVDATRIRVPVTLVAVLEDQLVPISRSCARCRRASAVRGTLVELSSLYGHDAFLKEGAALQPVFARALDRAGRCAMSQPLSATTRAVRAALESDTQHGAVVPPIHLTSTFAFESFGEKRTYDYTRSGNPTRDALGEALAELEGGAGAVVTSSGMSAVHLVVQLLGSRRSADRAARLLRRHVSPVQQPREARRGARASSSTRRTIAAFAAALALRARSWSGSRRPAIRCCGSSTFARWRRRRTPPARWCSSTTRSCRRCGSSRSRSARTSCCIRRRNI